MNQNSYTSRSHRRPGTATAEIRGSADYPDIRGTVRFRQTRAGVLVTAEISGLPEDNPAGNGIFAFHIHEGDSCTGTDTDPFSHARRHYNPGGMAHPFHAGDMPPLFGNHGYAYLSFLTDRFTVNEIIGRTVIIHHGVDDFLTQPAGNAGVRIACGIIVG